MVVDMLPLWSRIHKKVDIKMKRNLQQLCQFPLRGRMVVEEPEEDEEVLQEVRGVAKGWLSDDDIED